MVLMTRLLLPFTHGIEVSAITAALALAQRFDATLVVLSLIRLPQAPERGPRWEDIQQSNDFLAFVHHKAARSGVAVERVELYTHNPVSSIRALAQEMVCAGIVLVVRRGEGILLATNEVKQLLEDQSIPLYLVSLPAQESAFSLPRWLSRWLRSISPQLAGDAPAHR
jgi:Universal stress protein family